MSGTPTNDGEDAVREDAVRGLVRLALPPLRLTAASTLLRPEGPPRHAAPTVALAPLAQAAAAVAPILATPAVRPVALDVPARMATTGTANGPTSPACPPPAAPEVHVDPEPGATVTVRNAANAPASLPIAHVASGNRLRANRALGLAAAIVIMAVVFAVALAMERSMHGFPPGTF